MKILKKHLIKLTTIQWMSSVFLHGMETWQWKWRFHVLFLFIHVARSLQWRYDTFLELWTLEVAYCSFNNHSIYTLICYNEAKCPFEEKQLCNLCGFFFLQSTSLFLHASCHEFIGNGFQQFRFLSIGPHKVCFSGWSRLALQLNPSPFLFGFLLFLIIFLHTF